VFETAANNLSLSVLNLLLYDREKHRGNANRATLAVARKLVAYLVAVDRGQTHFLVVPREASVAAAK
jgi:transposase